MARLSAILFAVVATSLMGVFVIAVLVIGMDTWKPVTLAAAAGFVLSIPVTWLVSRQILAATKPRG
ncbi:hypothetical protein RXV95_15735 [Novosphingobium sp. ZN18A2]|uniref:hypothetical protein n=1 Tax=Novosphingobium sp. ZN18A2 TaxID=3079861 RepID=UPI0030CDFD97